MLTPSGVVEIVEEQVHILFMVLLHGVLLEKAVVLRTHMELYFVLGLVRLLLHVLLLMGAL